MSSSTISETSFDSLVYAIAVNIDQYGLENAIVGLTDDQLLVMVEADDKLLAKREAKVARERAAAWDTVFTAIRSELDRRNK